MLKTGTSALSGAARSAHRGRWPSSECPDWAYDSPSEGSLPAAVGVEQEPGQLPVSVLGVVGQDPPRGVASISGRSAWQVYDEVGILGHRSIVPEFTGDSTCGSIISGLPREPGGNTPDRADGFS